MKNLEVLHLENLSIHQIPYEIQYLKNLKRICVKNCPNISYIPSFLMEKYFLFLI